MDSIHIVAAFILVVDPNPSILLSSRLPYIIANPILNSRV
jgi:hypothetical protein